MRLFIALEIPEPVHRELSRLRDELEEELPPARWTRPGSQHVTLAFLGDTERGLFAGLDAALRPVFAAASPMELRVRGGGTFPHRRPARVAWLGLEAEGDLAGLQGAVSRSAFEAVGMEPDNRPFRSHVTMARPKKPWPHEAVKRFTAAAERDFGQPFVAREGVLFESRLGPAGARYRPLEHFAMEGAS